MTEMSTTEQCRCPVSFEHSDLAYAEDSYIMENDHDSAAAIPYVSLLDQTNTSLASWYVTTDLANALFSVPVHKDYQNQFAFSGQDQQYTFTVLP